MPDDVAILTGDLIGSTKAGPEAIERAMEVLAATSDEISGWQSDSNADTHFTRFRGDGWQILLVDAPLALRAAIVLMARLRAAGGVGTRLAIGIGALDSPGSANLSDASGDALERSGRALEQLKRIDRMAIAGLTPMALHRIILDLIDERMSRWTPEQAEAAALYLQPDNPTLADLAKVLGISPQAVNYRLSGAGVPRLRQSLRDWEAEIEFPEAAP